MVEQHFCKVKVVGSNPSVGSPMLYLFGKPLELVIFDNDGVILDLQARFEDQCRFAAKATKLSLETLSDWFVCIRRGERELLASLQQGIKDIWPEMTDEQMELYIQAARDWEQIPENFYPSVEGGIEIIHWLKQKGVKTAICTTNSYRGLVERLKKVNIDIEWFDATSTSDWKYPKPDPRAFDPILESIKTPKEHTVYIGDILFDWRAAKGAGIPFIAALSGGTPEHLFLRAGIPSARIVRSIAELPKLIEEK